MKTVLVVDDVATDRKLVARVVGESGHAIEYATNGAEAVKKAADIKPDLILMDVVMPEKDGFAACREIKKNEATKNIPVILITSKDGASDRHWASRQGANGYLTKPFEPGDLSSEIRKYL